MLRFILALMLSLVPRRSQDNLLPVARAINHVATTSWVSQNEPPNQEALVSARNTAITLIVIDFYENGFNPRSRFPFGVTSLARRLRGQPRHVWAEAAIRIWASGQRNCGIRNNELLFGFFNTGTCRRNTHAIGQARTVRNLRRNLSTIAMLESRFIID